MNNVLTHFRLHVWSVCACFNRMHPVAKSTDIDRAREFHFLWNHRVEQSAILLCALHNNIS